MSDLHELSVVETAKQIRERQISPVSLMEGLLERVADLEPSLNVWVNHDPDKAMDLARQRELELVTDGPRGPLHGVPVGIKDIYYTQGVLTTACSRVLADFIPKFDATTVARLKRSGAIIMGKTVTTEFACGDPPPTRNPWNLAHTPGGSSSGSAVGVATGMFPAALGSQTGGSILRPAAYNGVVGLKPTFGHVSRHGVIPVASSLDTMGPITRNVEDASLILQIIAGHDRHDQSSSSHPVPDYIGIVGNQTTPPRIGLVTQFFYDKASGETKSHTNEIAKVLNDAGAYIDTINISTDFDEMLAAHRVLMTAEGASVHQTWFDTRPDDYSPNIRQVIEAGRKVSALSYIQAKRIQEQFRHEIDRGMRFYDALLTPSTPTPAPRNLTNTGDPSFQTPFTFGGFPSISIPTGVNSEGMPFGVQLSSPWFTDATLLSTARWCERIIDANLKVPKISG